MNLLHIDDQRGWRGGEQQASYLIRGLLERGHRVILAGKTNGAFLAADHGRPVTGSIPAPFLGEWDLFTAWKLARAVSRYDIDILHAHTSHAHTLACLARSVARRGKVVVSRRVDFAPSNTFFNRWKYRLPDHIIAISRRIADVLAEFGVDTGRLSLVRSAVALRRFDVAPLSRAELGIPEDAILLGNVAALVGHKDHATLIEAMPAVIEVFPEARLVIAGEGELRPKLEAQIQRLNLGKAVTLLGYRKDVPRLLQALDVFVLSSKEEGLGTSILDAFACGVPVVASDGGGIPEMVTHEETGLLVPKQNPSALAGAIIRLLSDPSLAQALARNAAIRVRREFDVDTMVDGNIAVYERLLFTSRQTD